jgi:MFS family permease
MHLPTPLDIEIRRHLRYNVVVNLFDGAFFGLGLGFASFSTIIPLFVSGLTPSATLIGLVPAIHSMGWQFPQLFTAGWVSRLRKFKPMVLMMTINERIPFVGLAIVAFLLPRIGSQAALILTFLMLIWQGLGGGFTANAWTSLIAKIIPADSRGTFFGVQAAVANIMIGFAAVGAGYLLEGIQMPFNFTACFLLTGFWMAASWGALALTREPEHTAKTASEADGSLWHGARDVMRRNPNFNWFLIARILSQFASMGFAFYIVYALRRFDMDPITAGYLTATLTISQTVANAGMGWLGDRWGHRSMLIAGALAMAASAALAWWAPSLGWFYPVQALAGLANVSMWTISMAMTVDFGAEGERPVYIGLSNTLTAPATIIAPIVGGWLADSVDFEATFALSAILGLVTAMVLFFLVKDPRRGFLHVRQPLPHLEESEG